MKLKSNKVDWNIHKVILPDLEFVNMGHSPPKETFNNVGYWMPLLNWFIEYTEFYPIENTKELTTYAMVSEVNG